MKARVLAIGGSDSSGGAGIQADIKTITALGGYAMSAITAVTVQSTRGISEVHDVPAPIVEGQIEACLNDIGADAIKTGMLGQAEIVRLLIPIIDKLAGTAPTPTTVVPAKAGTHTDSLPFLVVDPVIRSTDGYSLLTDPALHLLIDELIPRADLVTPNIPEAEILSGLTIETRDDMARAAARILALGPDAVLIKGGHLKGRTVYDLLLTRPTATWFEHDRIDTRHSHGTGCTLASAAATGLAQGLNMIAAAERARSYIQIALKEAPGLGSGHGPLEHAHTVRPFP